MVAVLRNIRLFRHVLTLDILVWGIVVCGALVAWPSGAAEVEIADRVVVQKAARQMLLLKDDRVLRKMAISLGLLPEGDKKAEGDFRTPEGVYRLEKRNAASDFFLSIQISYPNPDDISESMALGVDPGGQIMIHGLPNNLKHSPTYYRQTDWTDGCIAVSNADMVDFWLMTSAGTPVEIVP